MDRYDTMQRLDCVQSRIKRLRRELGRMSDGELDFALQEIQHGLQLITLDIDRG